MKHIKNPVKGQQVHYKDGIKIWTGTRWYYKRDKDYIKTNCYVCNKKLVRYKNNNKNNRFYCSFRCRNKGQTIINDPKGSRILENKCKNFYYLIGFICADGCVTKEITNTSYVTISLNKKDRELLNKIQQKFGGRITESVKYNSVSWRIYNDSFVEYLIDNNITPRKSLTLNVNKFFNNLSTTKKWIFLRGVFDGDGGIIIKNKKINRCIICSGSESFAVLLYNFLKNQQINVYLHRRNTNRSNKFYTICINNSFCKNFLEKLYEDVDVLHLHRKILRKERYDYYDRKSKRNY